MKMPLGRFVMIMTRVFQMCIKFCGRGTMFIIDQDSNENQIHTSMSGSYATTIRPTDNIIPTFNKLYA